MSDPVDPATEAGKSEVGGTAPRAGEERRDQRRAEPSESEKEKQDALNKGEPRDVGYDETQLNQKEIEAGSVEHEQLLKSYPTATSYGPDVNVVVPEEEEAQPVDEEEPEAEDEERNLGEEEGIG